MNNPIFYNPHRSKVSAKAKTRSTHPLAGRKKSSPPSTNQSPHRSEGPEYARQLSGVDLVEVVDLTDSNGLESAKAKQHPADGNTAGVGDKIGGVEKRDSDDLRSLKDAVAYKEWDDSLVDPDSNAPKTSHINRSGTERNVSVLSPTTVGDCGDNLIQADHSPRGEGAGTGFERLDSQAHPLDATAGEQDHCLTDAAHQADSNHSTHDPHPNPNTTIHAIAPNSSGQTTDDQLPIPGSTGSNCDEEMDKQTQPKPTVTGSAERTFTPEGPANGTLEYGTKASRPEFARPSPTNVGLLDSTLKPTDPLNFFPPGSPTEVATDGPSPVDPADSSQGGTRGGTHKAMSAVGESSQQLPHHPHVISSPETAAAPNPPSKEHPATTKSPACRSSSKAPPLGKHDTKIMDYVNHLSREQRDQYAPLSDERRPNIPLQPRRDKHQGHEQPGGPSRKRKIDPRIPTSDKPVKRHRPLAKAAASPSSAGGISVSSSRDHARGNTPAIQGNDGPPPVDAKNNRFAVERLLNDRAITRRIRGRNRRVIQYCVRWEGYGPIHDRWRDASNIDPPLIQAYRASTRSDESVSDDGSGANDDDDGAEPVEHYRTQRSSRARSRRQ